MYQYLDDKKKKQLFVVIVGVFAILFVFLAIKALNAAKEFSYIGRGVYAANVITVNGKGEVFAVPDTATFSFSVIEDAKTVTGAQDIASKKTNDIIAALKAMGIEDKDIKTTGYNSYPQYEYQNSICPKSVSPQISASGNDIAIYCPPGKQVLKGYQVSQSIDVKIRKTDNAGAALTKVGDLGATNISGLKFVVDDMDKAEADARDKAIADAKDKAEKLSKSLGIRLSHIVNFYENGSNPQPYGITDMKLQSAKADSLVAAPQLPVGQNSIVSNVSITYEVK